MTSSSSTPIEPGRTLTLEIDRVDTRSESENIALYPKLLILDTLYRKLSNLSYLSLINNYIYKINEIKDSKH